MRSSIVPLRKLFQAQTLQVKTFLRRMIIWDNER